MPSRFTFIAISVAAPLLLAACEREAQQESATRQAQEPPAAETQAVQPPEPSEPQPGGPAAVAEQPASDEPTRQPAPEAQGQAAEGEGRVAVVPPEADAANRERQSAEAPQRQPAREPGEPAPEAAGVASVAAYVGRWAEEQRMCQQSYWVFTTLRLETPQGLECDIESTQEQEDGIDLQVACTAEEEPLAEPERGTLPLTFPDLPQTDTMTVSGGPAVDEAVTLTRCPRG